MRLNEEELIKELHRLADELGRAPTLQEFRDEGEYSATTYYDRFGSWREALEAAGFKSREPESKIPQEDLLAELLRLADDFDDSLSISLMNAHGKYSASTYQLEFGSWNTALETAGFEPNPTVADKQIPREDLLEDVERIAEDLGEQPTYLDVKRRGKYGERTYIRRFGSWSAALEEAGFDPMKNQNYVPDEQLLDDLNRLADELGRRPTSEDVVEHGNHSLATYQRHFGSWSAAVEAAFESCR